MKDGHDPLVVYVFDDLPARIVWITRQGKIVNETEHTAAENARSERTYTLTDIKRAFWAQFHQAGEVWFNYVGTPEENDASTESEWAEFVEHLQNPDRGVPREPER